MLSVKLHSRAFEKDQYHFLFSIINNSRISSKHIYFFIRSIGSISIGKKISKYEGNALLKKSNKTCFQNNIKVLLWFALFLYVRNSKTAVKKMVDPCCGNCSKVYWSISSKNKQRHWSENNKNRAISFNEETKLLYCQTAGCATIAIYKYKIVKHLTLSCQQETKKCSG